MPSLGNPQHERFSRLVANDVPVLTAHGQAGYRPDASNAWKLAKRPDIAARVSELQAEALSRQGITPERIIDAAAAIAFADLQGIAPDGTLEPGHRLTDAQAKAITSIEVTTDAKGRKTTRVKFGDRQAALQMLGRWAGFDKPSTPDPDTHMHVHVESPLSQISARISELAMRLGHGEQKAA